MLRGALTRPVIVQTVEPDRPFRLHIRCHTPVKCRLSSAKAYCQRIGAGDADDAALTFEGGDAADAERQPADYGSELHNEKDLGHFVEKHMSPRKPLCITCMHETGVHHHHLGCSFDCHAKCRCCCGE